MGEIFREVPGHLGGGIEQMNSKLERWKPYV
jgi:hypothetical protein